MRHPWDQTPCSPSADVDNIIAILKTVHANASPVTTVA